MCYTLDMVELSIEIKVHGIPDIAGCPSMLGLTACDTGIFS